MGRPPCADTTFHRPGQTTLVPNFTEEQVKRVDRILESNESLIDDLWQLAV
jgi:hypothetical protein